MGDVIQFPESDRQKNIGKLQIVGADTKAQYLGLCKSYLTTDDYEEVLCGILDEEYYNKQTDRQLRDIISTYYKYED